MGDPWDCRKISQEESFSWSNKRYAPTSKASRETVEKMAKQEAMIAKESDMEHMFLQELKVEDYN